MTRLPTQQDASVASISGGVSPAQAAKILGVSPSTIWRRLRDGSLPYLQLGGKRKRVVIDRALLNSPMESPIAPSSSVPQENVLLDGNPDSSHLPSGERLSGPRPQWFSTDYENQRSQVKNVGEAEEGTSCM